MTSSFFDGRRLWLWILAGWLIVGLYALLRPHCCVPRPTDDLFIRRRGLENSKRPLHRPNARFSVSPLSPLVGDPALALVMKLFGTSEAVLRLYPLIYMGGAIAVVRCRCRARLRRARRPRSLRRWCRCSCPGAWLGCVSCRKDRL
jgi:hypothetical protein